MQKKTFKATTVVNVLVMGKGRCFYSKYIEAETFKPCITPHNCSTVAGLY